MTIEIRMVFVGFRVWGVVRLAVYCLLLRKCCFCDGLGILEEVFALVCICGGL
jgi:hypothetical protein